jgi:DNA repair exonuclease SbcCD ATPase subunit
LEKIVRIISVELENFASYEKLEFNFENQGLTLIQGPTGVGKSTLCDSVAWCLFGITAKDGKADEILPWGTRKATKGRIILDNGIIINRSRGPNDLSFSDNGMFVRGKDMNDTQKMINSTLNITPDLYLSGAYFHEFSQTAQFFNTTAKSRRELCEQIVDLSLSNKLQTKINETKKIIGKEIHELSIRITTIKSNIVLLDRMQLQESTKYEKWEDSHKKTVDYVANLYEKFENNRTRVVHKECPTCKTILEKPKKINDKSPNPHADRLEELLKETNPHEGAAKDYTNEISNSKDTLHAHELKQTQLNSEYSDLEMLEDVLRAFRSTLIQNTISYIENNTNELLIKHFDAEIAVSFIATDADKLDVDIRKDGNTCSYAQLSKGQRQLLKLCFGIAVMKSVSNHSGVGFNTVFFDEALSGLDENFKNKAFKMLEELSLCHENVLVIDHSEGFKTLFPNTYDVRLVNGRSQICHH